MQTAFLEYTKKDNTKVKYYDLIIPQGTSTTYWMASRCVFALYGDCIFSMRAVEFSRVYAYGMCIAGTSTNNDSLALFPVVTLGSKLVKSGIDGTFAVSLE